MTVPTASPIDIRIIARRTFGTDLESERNGLSARTLGMKGRKQMLDGTFAVQGQSLQQGMSVLWQAVSGSRIVTDPVLEPQRGLFPSSASTAPTRYPI